MTKAPDVLTRLDSLLRDKNDTIVIKKDSGSKKSGGILKTGKASKNKKSLRFPDNEDLHEIIGYGGDMAQFVSDDEDEVERKTKSEMEMDTELTVEERNWLNLTKKNTSFNSKAENLCGKDVAPVRLGAEKKAVRKNLD